jgi:predicted lysophospholipase L1 biosynthesis ABC-type transport system permease subunit
MFRLNREHGTTLLLVTHDVDLAARCERGCRWRSARSSATSASSIEAAAVMRRRRQMIEAVVHPRLAHATLSSRLRLVARDWRAGELRVLIGRDLLAVASVGTVGFFADRVKAGSRSRRTCCSVRDLMVPAIARCRRRSTESATPRSCDVTAIRFNSMVQARAPVQRRRPC